MRAVSLASILSPAYRPDPEDWIAPCGELQVIAHVTLGPLRFALSSVHCCSAGIGWAGSMQAARVIGWLLPGDA